MSQKSVFELLRMWDTGAHQLFTPHERDRVWNALESGLAYDLAKARICARLRNLPLREADWRRSIFTHGVSAMALYDSGRRQPDVPGGWSMEPEYDRDMYIVGPAWVILPRRWYRELRRRFYRYAHRIGAIELEEGGYYRDARWWPRTPLACKEAKW